MAFRQAEHEIPILHLVGGVPKLSSADHVSFARAQHDELRRRSTGHVCRASVFPRQADQNVHCRCQTTHRQGIAVGVLQQLHQPLNGRRPVGAQIERLLQQALEGHRTWQGLQSAGTTSRVAGEHNLA